MGQEELKSLLAKLIATWENEVAEFKEANDNFSSSEIGKYFSALANEANLRNLESSWLVFGVSNKTRLIVGTDYRVQPTRLHGLKMQITDDTEPRITFRQIHELSHEDGRVLLFEIPPAPRGIPISWKGHYYARSGESLTSLGLDKLDEIRGQSIGSDWTAEIVSDATQADLDDSAVHSARQSFAQKHANRFQADEVMGWSMSTFLDRACLTRNGRLTRTTLLLLGNAESAGYLSPHPAQLTWNLEGQERAYEHFGLPFLLNTTRLYQRIRNIQLRLLPQDELVPVEVSKYDQKIVLEALHNCIAHQDYTRNARVVVTETPDRLIFGNEGNFFDGLPEDYVEGHKTPYRYRNLFLVKAMVELNMIDTMGYGIHEMYAGQARRYLPLPDYDFSQDHVVRVTVFGGVVDLAYSRLLIQKTDLPLVDVLALDRVQKKLGIPDDVVTRLKRAKLIEGRKPHFHVSAIVAKATATQADYIHTRAQDDEFYAKLLTDYLEKFGEANRAQINQLLLAKLSDALTIDRKLVKINNLLTKLRRKGVIFNAGTDKAPQWQLAEKK